MPEQAAHKKIKLFADRASLPPGTPHTILLYPFWGNIPVDVSDPDHERFDEYLEKGKDIFDITDQAVDADAFLLPFEFSFEEKELEEAKRLAKLASELNKKLIIFYNKDSDKKIPIGNSIIFRTSFYRSSRGSNEYALPGWSVDFIKYKTNENKNAKPLMPSVSYCGYIDYLTVSERFHWWRLYKLIANKTEKMYETGPRLRGEAVRVLMKDKNINTNFIIRTAFWAAGIDKTQARLQYAENMLGADYALVARGAGNFSYRLYEALSCGKIPVFIDTDSVLPFDDHVDWKKYMVWINAKEIKNIAQQLKDFHAALTESQFNELKNNCRKLYEEHISPVGFFSTIYRYI